jgi:Arc-like DNA binding dprotein
MPKVTQRGRPPKTPGEAKRAQFNTRVRPSLKSALDVAAQANRRSVSEEVEARLEQSFSLETILGSQEALLPAAAFALAGQHAAEATGQPVADWRNDRHCYEEAMLALLEVLWRQHPGPGDIPWRARRYWLQRAIGRLAAPYRETLNEEDLTLRPSEIDFFSRVES